jgi:arylformamidase
LSDDERAYVPLLGQEAEAPRRAALAQAVLARCIPEDLAYGSSPRARLDVFVPPAPNGAVALYFHGGYWRAGDRRANAFVAGPLIDAGVTAYIAGYDLAPAVTLSEIVTQARAARDRTIADARARGLDPARFLIAGSSAGANLTANLLLDADAWPAPPIAGLITGVFDLEPVTRTSVNDDLRLSDEEVRAYSPLRRAERFTFARAIVAAGGAETPEWQAGVAAFARRLERDGPVTTIPCPDDNHFSISTALGRADNPLTIALLAALTSHHPGDYDDRPVLA